MTAPQETDPCELLITRWLNASREQVFAAWTQPEHIVHWWGPKNFTVPSCRVEAKPGGAYRVCIRSAEGIDYWIRGEFREMQAPSRLVFTWAWEDDDGKPGHQTQVTLSFESVNSGTLMTFRQAAFESVEERDSHEGGWNECLDRLQSWLERMEHAKESTR